MKYVSINEIMQPISCSNCQCFTCQNFTDERRCPDYACAACIGECVVCSAHSSGKGGIFTPDMLKSTLKSLGGR